MLPKIIKIKKLAKPKIIPYVRKEKVNQQKV